MIQQKDINVIIIQQVKNKDNIKIAHVITFMVVRYMLILNFNLCIFITKGNYIYGKFGYICVCVLRYA